MGYSGRYEDNDSDGEDLARAMQETLSLQYPAPYGTSVIAPPGPVMAATPRLGSLKYVYMDNILVTVWNLVFIYTHIFTSATVSCIWNHSMWMCGDRSAGMSTCAGCHKQLGFGRFLTCLNQNWHPSCFCCRYCHKSIVDREVIDPKFPMLWFKLIPKPPSSLRWFCVDEV